MESTYLVIAVLISALASGAIWLALPLRAIQHDRRLRKLAASAGSNRKTWPPVSVLVPARNEAATLEAAMNSLLEVDYPDLEIILIDDRSTDGTGDIVETLGKRDSRIKPLHINSLEEGWLGKVQALHHGLESCRGEWLLFTDADVHFAPQTLRLALGHCLDEGKDFLSLLPDLRAGGSLVGSAQAVFGTLLLSLLDFDAIADPKNPKAMGVGAFNLARRNFLDAERGLEWLRMEVADDVGLALMMKSRGADIELLSAPELIEIDWYPTLASMFDGVLQRMLLGASYSLWVYTLQTALFVLGLCAPILLLILLLPLSKLAWLFAGVYLLPSILLGAGLRQSRIPSRLLWLWPMGACLVGYGMLRSAITVALRGGLYWRGTIYRLADLRAGQRVTAASFRRR